MATAMWRNTSRFRNFHRCLCTHTLSQCRSSIPSSLPNPIANSLYRPSLPFLQSVRFPPHFLLLFSKKKKIHRILTIYDECFFEPQVTIPVGAEFKPLGICGRYLSNSTSAPSENLEKSSSSSKTNSDGTRNAGGSQQSSGDAGKPIRGGVLLFAFQLVLFLKFSPFLDKKFRILC